MKTTWISGRLAGLAVALTVVVLVTGPGTRADEWQRGDLNCDAVVDAFDIDPFVLAITAPSQYVVQYPDCDWMLADINCDGFVNAFDIDPFVECLMSGWTAPLAWDVSVDPVIGPGVTNSPASGVTVSKVEEGSYAAWHDNAAGLCVMLTTSPDGFSWTPSECVHVPDQTNDAVPEVVIKENIYYLWIGQTGGATNVEHATSDDGIVWNHQGWVPDWFHYTVVPTENGFEAWYTLWDDYSCYWYATSADGLDWQPQGCGMPAGATGEFDAHLSSLDVIKLGGRYHMWYACHSGPGPARIAYATSDDGLTWEKHGLLSGFDQFGSVSCYSPSVLLDGGTLRMWFEAYPGQSIYYAECCGSGS